MLQLNTSIFLQSSCECKNDAKNQESKVFNKIIFSGIKICTIFSFTFMIKIEKKIIASNSNQNEPKSFNSLLLKRQNEKQTKHETIFISCASMSEKIYQTLNTSLIKIRTLQDLRNVKYYTLITKILSSIQF